MAARHGKFSVSYSRYRCCLWSGWRRGEGVCAGTVLSGVHAEQSVAACRSAAGRQGLSIGSSARLARSKTSISRRLSALPTGSHHTDSQQPRTHTHTRTHRRRESCRGQSTRFIYACLSPRARSRQSRRASAADGLFRTSAAQLCT